MKNGTEYVLRFGNLDRCRRRPGEGQSAEDKAATPADADKKADKSDVHRYLFVMARFNKDAVKQPELVKLPELPAKSEAQPADQTPRKQRRPRPKKAKRLLQKEHERLRRKTRKRAAAKADEAASRINQPSRLTRQSRPKAARRKTREEGRCRPRKNLAAEPDKEIEKVIAERKRDRAGKSAQAG